MGSTKGAVLLVEGKGYTPSPGIDDMALKRALATAQEALDVIWSNPELPARRAQLRPMALAADEDQLGLVLKVSLGISLTVKSETGEEGALRAAGMEPEQAIAAKECIREATKALGLPEDTFHFYIVGQVLCRHADIREAKDLDLISSYGVALRDGEVFSIRGKRSIAREDRAAGNYLREISTRLLGEKPRRISPGTLSGKKFEKREYELECIANADEHDKLPGSAEEGYRTMAAKLGMSEEGVKKRVLKGREKRALRGPSSS